MAALNKQTCIRTCSAQYNIARRGQWYGKRELSWTRRNGARKEQATKSEEQTHTTLLAELQARGLVHNTTNGSGLEKILETQKITAYCGVDPTADSLHLGNLMTLMPLIHLYTRGHNIIPLIGGFTCTVGDPSGRLTDREKMTKNIAINNIKRITAQLNSLFNNATVYASSRGFEQKAFGTMELVNNSTWWAGFKFSDYLSNVASYMRMGPMLGRESVKARLQSPEGIDAATFLYQSLQAYDFYHLFRTKNCQLQIGGSDQWGNITAGIDLCQKIDPSETKPDAYGLTVPLLLSASGEKFGKSAGNAVFLDAGYTHPFDLYQYLLRTPDSHTAQYLPLFTLLPLPQIHQILTQHAQAPEKRLAQRTLAEHLVTLVHRSEVAQKCVFQTSVLYPADKKGFDPAEVVRAFRDDGGGMFWRFGWGKVGEMAVSRILMEVGLVKSHGEGIRAVKNGGVYANGRQVKPGETVGQVSSDGKVVVIRFGRSSFRILELLSEEEEQIEGYAKRALSELDENT